MNGIDKITQRIEADAQQEIQALRARTDEQAQEILAQARAEAEAQSAQLLEKGKKQADERLQRLESAARMETRKLELAAKQEMLGLAFDQALETLCTLPEAEYTALLVTLALRAVTTGREQLIFSPGDRTRIGKQVVVAVNDALAKQVTPELPAGITESKFGAFLEKVLTSTSAMISGTGLLTLSEQTRPIRGGFIMVDGDVEINCSFEMLVHVKRESLELDVAKLLFD